MTANIQRLSLLDRRAEQQISAAAIESITEQQSTWRPAELVRELAAALPTETTMPADELTYWLDELGDRVERERCFELSPPVPPHARRRADGRPITESADDHALTTESVLAQEQAVIEWAARRLTYDGDDNHATGFRSEIVLSPGQMAAAAAVAGTDDLVLIVGPVGTGKTTALRPAVEQLLADGRALFGVAPSATAAEVLNEETGIAAGTLDNCSSSMTAPGRPTIATTCPRERR